MSRNYKTHRRNSPRLLPFFFNNRNLSKNPRKTIIKFEKNNAPRLKYTEQLNTLTINNKYDNYCTLSSASHTLHFKNKKMSYSLNKLENILIFFSKPLLFKYCLPFFEKKLNNFKNIKVFSTVLPTYVNLYFFYDRLLSNSRTNINPNENINHLLKKKILKIFSYSRFPNIFNSWFYQSLIKFFEFCTGRKICLKLNGFFNNILSVNEKTQCLLWAQKVKYFRKVLGPKLFLNESIQIMYLSLKYKDPYVLSSWMVNTMYKLSFWKYKTFLRYLKYVLRYFFWASFRELGIRGIKFQLKGKISVAGNARTRTAFHYIGFTSHATFDNKILHNLSLVRSFTGVMGLKLWIVF